jgi:hypothetical protein
MAVDDAQRSLREGRLGARLSARTRPTDATIANTLFIAQE